MRKSRKFEIISICKNTREVKLVATCTTKSDMSDEALQNLVAMELLKKDKRNYDHAWKVLR